VEATLSLVPTSMQTLTHKLTISMVGSSHALLQALSFHPFHSNVLLQLRWWYKNLVSSLELNGILLQFRHPLHLQVPDLLLEFDATAENFTANSNFESLTIAVSLGKKISPKLLDDIACSSVKHLTIGSTVCEWACHDSQVDLARRVVSGLPRRIQSLTLVSFYNFFNGDYEPFKHKQEAFDRLTQVLDSNASNNHGLSRLRFAFPNSRRQYLLEAMMCGTPDFPWHWCSTGFLNKILHHR
jgi:hypothetical protein